MKVEQPGTFALITGLVLLGLLSLPPSTAGARIERLPVSAGNGTVPDPGREPSEAMHMSTIEAEVLQLLQGEEFQGLTEFARLPPAEVVPVLAEHAKEDPDPLMRQRSVIALGTIGTAGAVPVLQDRLGDPSVPVAMSAIDALARLGHRPSAALIARLLERDDPSLRQKAAEALGRLADPAGEPPLRALLEREPEPFVRDTATRSLEQIKGRDAGTR